MVSASITHSGGTTLVDGAGGNGAALTGFEFKDLSGTVLPYVCEIVSATSIMFTVDGVPATMSFAMMNCPHNSDPTTSKSAVVPASVPCDNVVVLGSDYGCPLQPCAPIAIAEA